MEKSFKRQQDTLYDYHRIITLLITSHVKYKNIIMYERYNEILTKEKNSSSTNKNNKRQQSQENVKKYIRRRHSCLTSLYIKLRTNMKKTIFMFILLVFLFFKVILFYIIDIVRVTSSQYRKGFTGLELPRSVWMRFTRLPLTNTELHVLHLDIPVINPIACHKIIHFGNVDDGGWDICVDILDKKIEQKLEKTLRKSSSDNNNRAINTKQQEKDFECIIYSIGINDDISFDLAITDYYARQKCTVYAFDPTIGRETGNDFSPWIKFFNIGIYEKDRVKYDKTGTELQTLNTMRKKLNHDRKQIDVFKMDVEGNEWDVILEWFDSGLIGPGICPPFNVFAVEYHFRSGSYEMKLNILKKIRDAGFVPYSVKENWRYCDIRKISRVDSKGILHAIEAMNCMEVAYIYKGKNAECLLFNGTRT